MITHKGKTIPTDWQQGPIQVQLQDNTVHVWLVGLPQADAIPEALYTSLAPEEQQQADRFHFDKDRNNYIVAHAALRDLLQRYTGIDSQQLQFELNAYKKPGLHTSHHQSISFNLSHSYDFALIAFADQVDIGVDIELCRADIDLQSMAERFFSPAEVNDLLSLPSSDQLSGFYNAWTRKEAFIKAVGKGLSYPLDKFQVSLCPGQDARLIKIESGVAEDWFMANLDTPEGYKGAVVAAKPISAVELFWYKQSI